MGQGEKSGEVGWAGTPGGLGVRVPLEQGWLREDICSPGECDGGGRFLLEEVMGGGHGRARGAGKPAYVGNVHESRGRRQRGQALAEQPLKRYHPIPAQPGVLCYLGSENKNGKKIIKNEILR